MIKKSSTRARDSVFTASDFSGSANKRLEIKQIRSLVRELENLPAGAALPDWTGISLGDRVAIVAQLIPTEAARDEVMGRRSSFALTRYRAGAEIPAVVVAALAAETELPLQWIITGQPMERLAPLVRIAPEEPQADSDDVPIQKLAFKVSAGSGNLVLDENAEYVRFPRAILQHAGVAPQHARLWEASGDSMKSTINDGDTLLVDVSPSATQIVEGKIFTFSVGDDAFVKRLRRLGNDTIMISDNRELFPEQTVPSDVPFRVFGRVRWAGRNL